MYRPQISINLKWFSVLDFIITQRTKEHTDTSNQCYNYSGDQDF